MRLLLLLLFLLFIGNARAQVPRSKIGDKRLPRQKTEILVPVQENVNQEKMLSPEFVPKVLREQKETYNESVVEQSEFNLQTNEIVQKLEASGKALAPEALRLKVKSPGKEEVTPTPETLRGPEQYDSRIEILDLYPAIAWQQRILVNAGSVAMIIEKRLLHKVRDSLYELDISQKLGVRFNLCASEPYTTQPAIGVGTAFAVGKSTMVTARHVFDQPLSNYVIIFNFKLLNKKGTINPLLFSRDIYYPKKQLASDGRLDVSVFAVDRPLPCAPLVCSFKPVVFDTPLYMIGHPSGLPQKAAVNAEVVGNKDQFTFYSSLDAFQGNSGSPVFDRNTHQVIGILVAGGVDLQTNGGCNVSTLCVIPYCPGEKALRITAIQQYLLAIR
jgi:S1-C subfamily serine protease